MPEVVGVRPPWDEAQDQSLWFSNNFKNALEENGKYSWDIPYLNLYEKHYVFVYGTLKKGGLNNVILSGNIKNEFCGVGVTEASNYDFWIADTGLGKPRFPVAIYSGDTPRMAKVKGELWLVPTPTILRMDRLESNGKIYERNVASILIGTQRVPAFIYEGIPSFWRDKSVFNAPMLKQNAQNYHFFHQGMANNLKR